jgi:hypothetical protein
MNCSCAGMICTSLDSSLFYTTRPSYFNGNIINEKKRYQKASISGIDLFPQVCEHLAHIRNPEHHPHELCQKQGYVIVGVIPDANGLGKPDILMAKSVVR